MSKGPGGRRDAAEGRNDPIKSLQSIGDGPWTREGPIHQGLQPARLTTYPSLCPIVTTAQWTDRSAAWPGTRSVGGTHGQVVKPPRRGRRSHPLLVSQITSLFISPHWPAPHTTIAPPGGNAPALLQQPCACVRRFRRRARPVLGVLYMEPGIVVIVDADCCDGYQGKVTEVNPGPAAAPLS